MTWSGPTPGPPLVDDNSGKPEATTWLPHRAAEEEGAPCSVFGGKITTYRHLAQEAVEELAGRMPELKGPADRHGPAARRRFPDGRGPWRSRAKCRARYPSLRPAGPGGWSAPTGARHSPFSAMPPALPDCGQHFRPRPDRARTAPPDRRRMGPQCRGRAMAARQSWGCASATTRPGRWQTGSRSTIRSPLRSDAMSGDHLLVLDEGTTSTRAMLYTLGGDHVALAQAPLEQYYPAPAGSNTTPPRSAKTLDCAREMIARAGGANGSPQSASPTSAKRSSPGTRPVASR